MTKPTYQRVLFVWVSSLDLKAFYHNQHLGSIISILKTAKFDKAVLISKYELPPQYVNWLIEQLPKIPLQIYVRISSYRSDLKIADWVECVVQGFVRKGVQLVFYLSPLTLSFSVICLDLHKFLYPRAQLMQISSEAGFEVLNLNPYTFN